MEERQLLNQFISVMDELLLTGKVPADLPAEFGQIPEFQEMITVWQAYQQFAQAIANGDLSYELKGGGTIAGSLKSLQANLRHLTWQVQRIAAGDMSQQVEFLGEFSVAFNSMVSNLSQMYAALEQQRESAIILMDEAQLARQETEEANRLLQVQLEENRILQDQLRILSTRDGLTGLFNRHYLGEILPHELAQARRENAPLSLLMLDIDQFKRLNDTYGHRAGDMVLQRLGKLILGRVRQSDVPCRYGGEEFIIVLPNTSVQGAVTCAEELRLAFEKILFEDEERTFQVTFSVGVAVFPDHAVEEEDLLRAVDRALYMAKSSGRNCVAVAEWKPGEKVGMHL